MRDKTVSETEILKAEYPDLKRDDRGRFRPGFGGGPGRPKGLKGKAPKVSDHLAAARRVVAGRQTSKPLDYFYSRLWEKCRRLFMERLTALEAMQAERVRERYIRRVAENTPKPEQKSESGPAPAVESATVPETTSENHSFVGEPAPGEVEALLAEIARKAQE